MRIYVGQLPFSSNDEELAAVFTPYGEVASARVIRDYETGRSRGFGFVEMANDTQAQSAIEALNGVEMGGRKIVVNEAKPRQPRPRQERNGW
jgi:RNA recognition motif-containing protein